MVRVLDSLLLVMEAEITFQSTSVHVDSDSIQVHTFEAESLRVE